MTLAGELDRYFRMLDSEAATAHGGRPQHAMRGDAGSGGAVGAVVQSGHRHGPMAEGTSVNPASPLPSAAAGVALCTEVAEVAAQADSAFEAVLSGIGDGSAGTRVPRVKSPLIVESAAAVGAPVLPHSSSLSARPLMARDRVLSDVPELAASFQGVDIDGRDGVYNGVAEARAAAMAADAAAAPAPAAELSSLVQTQTSPRRKNSTWV